MRRNWILTGLGAVALMAGTACGDGSCYDNGSSLPLARFYTADNTAVTVNTLTVRGIDAPGDSLLIDNTATGEFYLPLRATTHSTQYVLSYGEELTPDTLTLHYTPVPYFASHECGAMYNFQVTDVDVTHHLIDSVALTTTTITNATTVALRIYVNSN